jgi:hypothetical protein
MVYHEVGIKNEKKMVYHDVGAATTTLDPSSAADPFAKKSFKETVFPFAFFPFLPEKENGEKL